MLSLSTVLIHFLISIEVDQAKIPLYCPCILFNTTGVFHSPNYPSKLKNINCLFYHFRAPSESIVQITFNIFSLPTRNPTIYKFYLHVCFLCAIDLILSLLEEEKHKQNNMMTISYLCEKNEYFPQLFPLMPRLIPSIRMA
ncbi:hypothetical protein DICVIV_12642 [Dictyocaulus viviparus]|uniref:CUB domain-containing protein n=1 Tax=Dictyocaulus viviparus TaxID=29172 RepID=A0A0D8XG83_DICVI|nr:hypothetical protein DICVIV_12642 [Dictyocaulus viviparus]